MSEAGDKIIAGLNEALTEAERALCGALDAFVETHIEIVGNIEDAATRIIELSRQLHAAEAQLQAKEDGLKVRDRRLAAAEADAARLAEAGTAAMRLGVQTPEQLTAWIDALTAHSVRLIDG